jgi:orotidine-5'-phosphate decarboxylase
VTNVDDDPAIIVALDFPEGPIALEFAMRLDPARCRVKVGQELFTAAGPRLVQQLVDRGFGVFLDLKFHDIPNTVAAACRAAVRLGVWMLNVHALGGSAMLRAAREAVPIGSHSPKLIAVTLLTSMSPADLSELGAAGSVADTVSRLAHLSIECGLDGVVCSALEVRQLREKSGTAFCLVTPGIRPANAASDDQHRIMTPSAAIAAGANYLVIGRPITRAADPLAALREIHDEIASAVRPS